MPRDRKKTVRLSEEEDGLCAALAVHYGINDSGVLRMALLELSRAVGIPHPKEKAAPAAR